jgi:hypothetical protein
LSGWTQEVYEKQPGKRASLPKFETTMFRIASKYEGKSENKVPYFIATK